jgi:hypothetical protein
MCKTNNRAEAAMRIEDTEQSTNNTTSKLRVFGHHGSSIIDRKLGFYFNNPGVVFYKDCSIFVIPNNTEFLLTIEAINAVVNKGHKVSFSIAGNDNRRRCNNDNTGSHPIATLQTKEQINERYLRIMFDVISNYERHVDLILTRQIQPQSIRIPDITTAKNTPDNTTTLQIGNTSPKRSATPMDSTQHPDDENHKNKKKRGFSDEEKEDGMICTICYENNFDTVLTPCGHVFCSTCVIDAKKISQSCPMCRRDIRDTVRLFI